MGSGMGKRVGGVVGKGNGKENEENKGKRKKKKNIYIILWTSHFLHMFSLE